MSRDLISMRDQDSRPYQSLVGTQCRGLDSPDDRMEDRLATRTPITRDESFWFTRPAFAISFDF